MAASTDVPDGRLDSMLQQVMPANIQLRIAAYESKTDAHTCITLQRYKHDFDKQTCDSSFYAEHYFFIDSAPLHSTSDPTAESIWIQSCYKLQQQTAAPFGIIAIQKETLAVDKYVILLTRLINDLEKSIHSNYFLTETDIRVSASIVSQLVCETFGTLLIVLHKRAWLLAWPLSSWICLDTNVILDAHGIPRSHLFVRIDSSIWRIPTIQRHEKRAEGPNHIQCSTVVKSVKSTFSTNLSCLPDSSPCRW